MTALWVLIGTVAVVAVLAVLLNARSGRVRPATTPAPVDIGVDLEPFDGVTLLQLSTTFCAPCQQAKVVLGELAEQRADLRHIELDLTQRPELAERLRVREAPTTLALDSDGRELFRVVGVPRKATLTDALDPHRSGT